MHVLCFGAGAIGSLVGGRLSLAGVDVTLLARRDHVAAIRTRGLTLETPGGRVVCKRIDSVTSLEDVATSPDLVILTVKAYQTQDALRSLGERLGTGIPVLSLQNGVGNEEMIAAAFGPARTIAGTITISAGRPRPGVVRQHSKAGGIGVAPVDTQGDASMWASLFRRAGFSTVLYHNYRAMKWSKLLLNLFTNASAAILDLPPAAIIDDPRLFEVERRALREALAVMTELGLHPVTLPGYPVPALRSVLAAPSWIVRPLLRRMVRRGRGEARPSLWYDLQRGRTENEVMFLNGAVTEAAAGLGVSAPVNAALTRILSALAAGRLDPAEFRGRPEMVLAEVERVKVSRW